MDFYQPVCILSYFCIFPSMQKKTTSMSSYPLSSSGCILLLYSWCCLQLNNTYLWYDIMIWILTSQKNNTTITTVFCSFFFGKKSASIYSTYITCIHFFAFLRKNRKTNNKSESELSEHWMSTVFLVVLMLVRFSIEFFFSFSGESHDFEEQMIFLGYILYPKIIQQTVK